MAAIDPRPIPVCSAGLNVFVAACASLGGKGKVPLEGVVEGVLEPEAAGLVLGLRVVEALADAEEEAEGE